MFLSKYLTNINYYKTLERQLDGAEHVVHAGGRIELSAHPASQGGPGVTLPAGEGGSGGMRQLMEAADDGAGTGAGMEAEVGAEPPASRK